MYTAHLHTSRARTHTHQAVSEPETKVIYVRRLNIVSAMGSATISSHIMCDGDAEEEEMCLCACTNGWRAQNDT